jgi:hypothetical protein
MMAAEKSHRTNGATIRLTRAARRLFAVNITRILTVECYGRARMNPRSESLVLESVQVLKGRYCPIVANVVAMRIHRLNDQLRCRFFRNRVAQAG